MMEKEQMISIGFAVFSVIAAMFKFYLAAILCFLFAVIWLCLPAFQELMEKIKDHIISEL